MPLTAPITIGLPTGDVILPRPSSLEIYSSGATIALDELDWSEYSELVSYAVHAVHQERTRTGLFVVYTVPIYRIIITLPWVSPYSARVDFRTMEGVYTLNESQGRDNQRITITFFKGDIILPYYQNIPDGSYNGYIPD